MRDKEAAVIDINYSGLFFHIRFILISHMDLNVMCLKQITALPAPSLVSDWWWGTDIPGRWELQLPRFPAQRRAQ